MAVKPVSYLPHHRLPDGTVRKDILTFNDFFKRSFNKFACGDVGVGVTEADISVRHQLHQHHGGAISADGAVGLGASVGTV